MIQWRYAVFIILTSAADIDPWEFIFDTPGYWMAEHGRPKYVYTMEQIFGSDIFLLNEDEAERVCNLFYRYTLKRCRLPEVHPRLTLNGAQSHFEKQQLDIRRIGADLNIDCIQELSMA